MASFAIKVPLGFQEKQALELSAKFSKCQVEISESGDVFLPTLQVGENEYLGLIPVAFALARESKGAPKQWAKTVVGDGSPDRSAEIQQFSSLAQSVFGISPSDVKSVIGQVSTHLKNRTYVASLDVPTLADVLLFTAIYPHVSQLSDAEKTKAFAEIVRWCIHINEVLEKPFPEIKVPHIDYVSSGKGQHIQKSHQGGNQQQQNQQMPQGGRGRKNKNKGGQQQQQQQEQDTRDPFSWIDVRVGKIVKVWPHPNADQLYCEEIDIGNGEIRKVVTGVRNFVPIEEMQDRHVVVFVNIKPSKIRGMPSESMVFAGSNAEHTVVELLDPPADTPIGTRVTCGDFVQGEVPGVDKKGKYWEAVNQNNNLTINAEHLACYKGVPLQTPQGFIKVKTLANTEFH